MRPALAFVAALSLASFAAAQVPEDEPVVLELGTLGAVGDDAPPLARALTTVLARDGAATEPPLGALEAGDLRFRKGQRAWAVHVDGSAAGTSGLVATIVDHESDAAYVKNMVTGAAQMDGAILVVGSGEGVTDELREQVRHASQLGVSQAVGWIDLDDPTADPAGVASIEHELRDLLSSRGFPGDDTPIIRGSALGGLGRIARDEDALRELASSIDSSMVRRRRAREEELVNPVDRVQHSSRGTIAIGTIETGHLDVDLPITLEVVGAGGIRGVVVTAIDTYGGRHGAPPEAGDRVGLTIDPRMPAGGVISGGDVIAAPGTVRPHDEFVALVHVKMEGGRHTPFHNRYRPQFVLRTADVTGEIELPAGREMIAAGENGEITVKLINPVAMDKGLRFTIREGGRTVGAGQVIEIIE